MSETTEKKNFKNELGISADVERELMESKDTAHAALLLEQAAALLNPKPILKHLGSAAVHVFRSEILQQTFIVSQAGTMGSCPEVTADAAFTDLRRSLKEHYGRKSGKLRSGF